MRTCKDELVLAALLAGDTATSAFKQAGWPSPAVKPSKYYEGLVTALRNDGYMHAYGVYKTFDRGFDVGLTYMLLTDQLDFTQGCALFKDWVQLWRSPNDVLTARVDDLTRRLSSAEFAVQYLLGEFRENMHAIYAATQHAQR